ncbi:TetR/AcrR family transcriptional regulator [Azospirillum thermophilum]|uniref:TetR family transcriptional regulator n=1 Tax=Azospirillum thermophilum TaxID=2202148 RepID=A0A2S2CUK4_9PROT|nr:TetR/AcrR family transcriptional regulator [Azospirillum thermophilum]AWK88168.1 TetR family transcriptional regulator [Azospirillum thermophilum]
MTEQKSRGSIGARRNPETERAVLDAAEAILVEGGYPALSIEAVARRARAGKPTVYRWWPSRGRLLLAVYDRRKQDIAIPDTGSLDGDLLLFLKRLFAFWATGPNGDLFRLIIAEAQSDPDVAAALADYVAQRRRMIAAIFDRALLRGDMDPQASSDIAAELTVAAAWNRLLHRRLDPSDEALVPLVRQIAGTGRPRPVRSLVV